MDFSERLKELRKEHGYTQVTLAEALGVSKGTVAMWETGKRTPDYEIINIMSDMFDRRIDFILGYSDDPTSPKISEQQIDELGEWVIEDEYKKVMKDYISLDEYGKAAVESIIQLEKLRCMNQQNILQKENNQND